MNVCSRCHVLITSNGQDWVTAGTNDPTCPSGDVHRVFAEIPPSVAAPAPQVSRGRPVPLPWVTPLPPPPPPKPTLFEMITAFLMGRALANLAFPPHPQQTTEIVYLPYS